MSIIFSFLRFAAEALIPNGKRCPVCGGTFTNCGRFSLPRSVDNARLISVCDDPQCQLSAKERQLANWNICKESRRCFTYEGSPVDLLGPGVNPYFNTNVRAIQH